MKEKVKKKMKIGLLDLIYPVKCPFCGTVTGDGICEACRKRIRKIEEPYCMKCGKPVPSVEQEYCYDCSRKTHEFEEGRSIWVHKSPVSDALYAFKYQNRRIYGEIFGRELAELYGGYLREKEIHLIVPVPLHRKKRQSRGYNQAEIIARILSERTGIPIDTRLLVRRRATVPQKQLNDKARRKNIRGAFAARGQVKGQNLVLVDDIYTTGSTLDEAARILRRAGAQKVFFLTISIGQGF